VILIWAVPPTAPATGWAWRRAIPLTAIGDGVDDPTDGGLSMSPGQWLFMLILGVLLTGALGIWVVLPR
jgi:hypothetical protein